MIQSTRRQLLITTAASAVAPLSFASDEQPIRITVGFPAGGTTDVIARLVANGLSSKLGRSVIVENRAGASGNIAAQAISIASPDGNNLLFVPSSHATNASLYKNLSFDTKRDFTSIGIVATTPYVLVVNPQLPAKTLSEFVALLKSRPGYFQYATASQGTGQHLAAVLFMSMANVKMMQIPYKGSAAAFPDLIAGRTPIMFENVALVVPHIRSGALRPLAITSAKRSPLLPDVPTVAETLPGYEILGWFALMAPAKTPASVIERYNSVLNEVVNSPTFIAHLKERGAEPMTGTPSMANNFIQEEISRWGDVIRSANISLS